MVALGTAGSGVVPDGGGSERRGPGEEHGAAFSGCAKGHEALLKTDARRSGTGHR
jgi:hypothetical protein